MNSLFNKEVVKNTEEILETLESELDVVYCDENNISFSNSEVDMSKNPLISERSMNEALDLLYSKS